nr:hypothetical protein Iba_chr02aCG9780 [Ipomoea batatas]
MRGCSGTAASATRCTVLLMDLSQHLCIFEPITKHQYSWLFVITGSAFILTHPSTSDQSLRFTDFNRPPSHRLVRTSTKLKFSRCRARSGGGPAVASALQTKLLRKGGDGLMRNGGAKREAGESKRKFKREKENMRKLFIEVCLISHWQSQNQVGDATGRR